MNTYNLKITFVTELLGTIPVKDIATRYVLSLAEDEEVKDEIETLPDQDNLEKITTSFHKLDGRPIIYNYQIKGFFKEAGQNFNGIRGIKNLRSKLNNFLFVEPRRIVIDFDGEIEMLERPLRGMTARGPRISLIRSEKIPIGASINCQIVTLNDVLSEPLIRDLLDYGKWNGMGQWRNGGWGQFKYQLEKVKE